MSDAGVYVLNEGVFTRGGDTWIEDERGDRAFEVIGPMSATQPHFLLDPDGRSIYEIAQTLPPAGRVFEIRQGSSLVARVKAATISFLAGRYSVTLADGEVIPVKGRFTSRELRALRNGRDAFIASGRLASVGNSYGIRISPDFDVPLALAILVAIEQMERP